MIERVIIAGSGGQGIMLAGKILAEAAMNEGKQVSWFPSYGAEVRGGTAYCMVTVSDKEIGSPYIEKADALVVMNQPSLDRFSRRLKKNGLLFLNSSLSGNYPDKNMRIAAFPFTDIAADLGNPKAANTVALGLYIARTRLVKKESVVGVFYRIAPAGKQDLIKLNVIALEKGMSLDD